MSSCCNFTAVIQASDAFTPLVRAWYAQVIANGGAAPSNSTLLSMSTFDTAISSLKSRIWHLNVIAPDSLIAAKTPLIHTYGNSLWVDHQIGTGGQSVGVGGLSPYGDNANGFVYDTGVNANSIASFNTGNGGMSVYVPSGVFSGAPLVCGNANFGAGRHFAIYFNTPIQFYTDLLGHASKNVALNGFVLGSRTSTTVSNIYFANSGNPWAVGTTDVTLNTTAFDATTLAVAGWHDSATGYNYMGNPLDFSFFAVHDGFSSADGQTLYNAVQAFRVAIGGGFL